MKDKNIKISIIGLGYVGLPLAVAFAEKFRVIGYDTDQSRIKELNNGNDKTLEVGSDLLKSVGSNLSFTSDILETNECNIYIVTVPTPIDNTNRPDLSPLVEASQSIAKVLKKMILSFMNLLFIQVLQETFVFLN